MQCIFNPRPHLILALAMCPLRLPLRIGCLPPAVYFFVILADLVGEKGRNRELPPLISAGETLVLLPCYL